MTADFARAVQFLIRDSGRNAGLHGADQALAVLGCRLALPLDAESLAENIRQMITENVSQYLLQAAFLHAVGYLGAVRVVPAFRILTKVLTPRSVNASGALKIAPTHKERVVVGTALYERFDPGRAAKQDELYEALSPQYYPMAMEFAGVTLGDPAIDTRQRQVMTIAMLSCLGGQSAQLTFHAGVALDRGVSPEQLGAILVTVQAYAGLPRANAAAMLVREVINMRRQ